MARVNKLMTLPDRLGRILQFHGWSQSQLAREVGVTPGAVGHWMLRDKQMDARFAFILQDRHGWNARWVLEGVGPERVIAADRESAEILAEILSATPERRRALRTLLKS